MFKEDVLCIGSATLDHFLTVEQSLKSIKLGDKVLVNRMEKHSGGGATNAAAALSKLGLKVKILSKLGNDHDADFILKEMKQYKVKNICLHHSYKNTDFSTLISSSKEKDRVIYVHKGASQDLLNTDFKKSQLKAKWIYLSSLLGKSFQTATEIVQYAQKKKIKILFNPSLYLDKKGKSYLASILKKTTILVLNKEEAAALSKTNTIKKMLLKLHQFGPETVVITNGIKKLHALHENIIYSLIPSDVKVVHTAGAGDAFTSGLLAGIIKNYSFTDALRLGQVNSYAVIQHIGTKNKLLTEKEAKLMMRKYKIKVHKNVL
ncbi:MAG: carbohydrate kinase family protein [Nanoarchaeota archaeon]|nr:carbohydrate kinase family protein [Nanoarchaeota archaeon]MBU1622566.1 carbohydrate kinase family protein [Nanoarchaeota archaeon]